MLHCLNKASLLNPPPHHTLSILAGDILNKKLEILTIADSIGKELTGLKESGTNSIPQIRKELENILKKMKAL